MEWIIIIKVNFQQYVYMENFAFSGPQTDKISKALLDDKISVSLGYTVHTCYIMICLWRKTVAYSLFICVVTLEMFWKLLDFVLSVFCIHLGNARCVQVHTSIDAKRHSRKACKRLWKKLHYLICVWVLYIAYEVCMSLCVRWKKKFFPFRRFDLNVLELSMCVVAVHTDDSIA